jgi:hypothetical protein
MCVAVGAMLASACGKTIVVNGLAVDEGHWNALQDTLASQASFDLSCAPDQLQLMPLERMGNHASVVGVSGCGRRGAYTMVGDTWYASGQAAEAAQRQQELDAQEQMRRNQSTPYYGY